MKRMNHRLVRTADWLKIMALLGLFCVIAASPARATVIATYSVTLLANSLQTTAGGTCLGLVGSTGSLEIDTTGVSLLFGTGALGTSTSCGASLLGTLTSTSFSPVGTFVALTGVDCNGGNCNGNPPPGSDNNIAGFTSANTFEITDQFTPPPGTGGGGSLEYLVQIKSSSVPEPTSMFLMGSGLLGLAVFLKRSSKSPLKNV